jgi:hypothetical protein
MREAWVEPRSGVLVVRLDLEDDGPVFLGLDEGPGTPAIGGLDVITPDAVVALRVICDGMMSHVAGRLRLDMATWAILLVATSADRQELDDRLCDLSVRLVQPDGYDRLRASGACRSDQPLPR